MMSAVPEDSPLEATGAPAREELRGGRYVVLGLLGHGSQGETLEALDKQVGRPVAIKRFTIRGAKSWKDVELAEREASVLSALSHPSLPRYIEHFEENGTLCLVMEKIEGETLAARRKRGAPLDQQQVVRFLKEAAVSLRYLHGQAPPIVHRDIKPGNVILRPDGSYCVVDFGSVRDRLKPEGGSTVVGTFGFMAPEQFQGRAAPGSDVYAVAATAISLLTGLEPEDLPHKGLGIDVEKALRGQVDRRLIGALRSMLEPDPERRASSVDEALRQYGLHESQPLPGETGARAAKKARQARIESQGWGRDQREGAWHHQSNAERLRERFEQKQAERDERQRRKAEQREARRQARKSSGYGRHGWPRPGPRVPPGIVLGLVILIALRVAAIATFALFQVLLPTLFTLLSVLGGRAMYQRGRRMIQVGQAGQRGLDTASQHIRYQFLGGPEPMGLPVVSEGTSEGDTSPKPPSPKPPARVSIETDLEDLEAEIESQVEDAIDDRRQRR